MIREQEITDIGQTLKPHGINGEISATIDRDIDLNELKCIIFDIDGIYVPFFISSYRARGSEAVLLTIDGVTDETEAAKLCGKDIFALKSDVADIRDEDTDEGFYISDLVGYTLLDIDNKPVGKISGYDDSTANTLLTIELEDGSTKYVPVADDLIEDFNPEDKSIKLNLPAGIFEL
ncbi:MAG: ribosome maturation factor RimM [Muribaculaceae bacterium]|nr:ribosome maturation factor RimM [Muribaculaceae bacterium]